MTHPSIPATPDDQSYRTEVDHGETFGVGEDQGDVFSSDDPVALFARWFALARKSELNDANAMALATVDANGLPNVRMVLLKDFSALGFSFYTNADSAKGRELAISGKAGLCFHWKSIRRQIRIRGAVTVLEAAENDAYFAERARGAQIGAWASQQSRPLPDPAILARRVAEFEEIYKDRDVHRPPVWGGYLVIPEVIEFWVNRPYRLHDRLEFTKNIDDSWSQHYLYP